MQNSIHYLVAIIIFISQIPIAKKKQTKIEMVKILKMYEITI